MHTYNRKYVGMVLGLSAMLAACGPSTKVATPVQTIGGGLDSKTREERILERLDSLSLQSTKGSSNVYHVFTLSWTPLLDLMNSGDTLELERTAPNGAIESAVLNANSSQYQDSNIPTTTGLTYRYRLILQSDTSTFQTSFFTEGTTSLDPMSVKPVAPGAILVNGQKSMVQKYLNGFKVKWNDLSNNETKFEIEKCVWELIEVTYQDESTSIYEECTSYGGTIVIDTSLAPETTGEREYFDSDVSPSYYDDNSYQNFISDGYCYSIRALNAAGASVWTNTECKRFE